jgi:hypothetical protein
MVGCPPEEDEFPEPLPHAAASSVAETAKASRAGLVYEDERMSYLSTDGLTRGATGRESVARLQGVRRVVDRGWISATDDGVGFSAG